MRERIGLLVMIGIGLVFLLGSALALVELGTSRTVCRSGFSGTVGRISPVCATTGGTSPVVYVILIVAIVIGVICLAAGITVLAVRISAPPRVAVVASSPAGAGASSTPPGWYTMPGGQRGYWDGSRWVQQAGNPPQQAGNPPQP